MRTMIWNKWRVGTLVLSVALLAALNSCGNAEKPAPGQIVQRTFATPDEAGSAVSGSSQVGRSGAVLAIFGPDGKTALFSGDAVKDKNNLAEFCQRL